MRKIKSRFRNNLLDVATVLCYIRDNSYMRDVTESEFLIIQHVLLDISNLGSRLKESSTLLIRYVQQTSLNTVSL